MLSLQRNFRPIGSLASKFGVKAAIYGQPGTAKTPIVVGSSPNPVTLVTEPGMLSVRHLGSPAFQATTMEEINEFFAWLKGSNERRQFQTVCVDSASHMAEVILEGMTKKHSHGLKAYGEMANLVRDHLNALYFLEEAHTMVICKLEVADWGNGAKMRRPWFPGQELPVKFPHLFDELLFAHVSVPATPTTRHQLALQCAPSYDLMARDRSGKLNMIEPFDISHIIGKCFS
jgi:hypothetical protein